MTPSLAVRKQTRQNEANYSNDYKDWTSPLWSNSIYCFLVMRVFHQFISLEIRTKRISDCLQQSTRQPKIPLLFQKYIFINFEVKQHPHLVLTKPRVAKNGFPLNKSVLKEPHSSDVLFEALFLQLKAVEEQPITSWIFSQQHDNQFKHLSSNESTVYGMCFIVPVRPPPPHTHTPSSFPVSGTVVEKHAEWCAQQVPSNSFWSSVKLHHNSSSLALSLSLLCLHWGGIKRDNADMKKNVAWWRDQVEFFIVPDWLGVGVPTQDGWKQGWLISNSSPSLRQHLGQVGWDGVVWFPAVMKGICLSHKLEWIVFNSWSLAR